MSMSWAIVCRLLLCGIFLLDQDSINIFLGVVMECITSIGTGNPLGIYQCVMVGHTWHSSKDFHLQHCCKIQYKGIGKVAYALHWMLEHGVPLHPDPFIPSYDFYGRERNIYFLYWHWHYVLTFLTTWQIENLKMISWCFRWLTLTKDAIGAGSDCADCVCWVTTNHKHYHHYHFGFPIRK